MSLWLTLLLACQPPAPSPAHATALIAAPWEGPAPGPDQAQGLVYVPVWSSVLVREGERTFDLTVMLSVRNTDPVRPLTVRRATFHDRAGASLHAYAEAPIVLGPLGSAEAVIGESDTRAGVGGSFVVGWAADGPISPPAISAVMLGTGQQQGISFVSEGRPITTATP